MKMGKNVRGVRHVLGDSVLRRSASSSPAFLWAFSTLSATVLSDHQKESPRGC